jgi:MinD superfamily P-loop ATPase
LEIGHAGETQFVHGILNIGEAMSPPVIRSVKAAAPPADLLVIDSPPGTSCPVIESVRGADLVLLVTEPTPFGLNDLELAVEMVRTLGLRFGVVINRSDLGDNRTEAYCRAQGMDVLTKIPDDRRVAEAYSRGEMICEALPSYRDLYTELLDRLEQMAPAGAQAESQS